MVMLVTDRSRLAERLELAAQSPAALDALMSLIGEAARSGVDVIQVRERDLPDRTLADLVRRAVVASAGTKARVVVNDRLDVALACGAGGVHLPERGLPPERARGLLPEGSLVGASAHDPSAMPPEGSVDYVVFGTVFPTRSKPAGHWVSGVSGLRAAVAAASVPVLAIGGITVERLAEIAAVGAGGVAAVDLFLPAPPGQSSTPLRRIVEFVHEAFDSAPHVS